jgi:hypothetical protein
MGLFGKSEEELRATGTPTSARVTYVDDSGKRRNGDAEAKAKFRVQIDSGVARGRELEKTKWVPVALMPRVGDHVSIRFDPDDPDDWAWGDGTMYQPVSPGSAPAHGPAPMVSSGPAPMGQQPGNPGGAVVSGPMGMPSVGDIKDLMALPAMWQQAMASGGVTIEHQGQVIDARGNPELRKQILESLRASGVDVSAMEANWEAPPAAPAASAGAQSAAPGDLAARLKRLDDLRAQGLISEEEHREQRQRIIDTI